MTVHVSVCDPPGDIKQWEANAVFDENGEVCHLQHRRAVDDVDRAGGE